MFDQKITGEIKLAPMPIKVSAIPLILMFDPISDGPVERKILLMAITIIFGIIFVTALTLGFVLILFSLIYIVHFDSDEVLTPKLLTADSSACP